MLKVRAANRIERKVLARVLRTPLLLSSNITNAPRTMPPLTRITKSRSLNSWSGVCIQGPNLDKIKRPNAGMRLFGTYWTFLMTGLIPPYLVFEGARGEKQKRKTWTYVLCKVCCVLCT